MVPSVTGSRPSARPLLHCRDLSLAYHSGPPVVHRVSFALNAGKTTALVGESGSGKSTIARAIVGLLRPCTGSILFDGTDLATLPARLLPAVRKRVQLVFQDPWNALNPRLTIRQLLTEPLSVHFPQLRRAERLSRMTALLEQVHLPADCLDRFPAEFSGGQRQRILIARALAVEPEVLICDEPVSALDVSIQARLLDLLRELRQSSGLTLLFISHDLAVVQQMADDVLVLRRGELVEHASADRLFQQPAHAYTRELIDACPRW